MTGELLKDEKDLVILLGSSLVYKQVDILYDLICYIESYSTEDLFEIINAIKKHIPSTIAQWFCEFLIIVRDITLLNSLLNLPLDIELINWVVKSYPEVVDYFVTFWGA